MPRGVLLAYDPGVLEATRDGYTCGGGRLRPHGKLSFLHISLKNLLILDIFLVHVASSTVDDAWLRNPVFVLFQTLVVVLFETLLALMS